MTHQAKTGHVGNSMNASHVCEVSTDGIEFGSTLHHLLIALGRQLIFVHGRAQDAYAETLAQHQHITILSVIIALDFVWVNKAHNSEPIYRLRRINRVTAGDWHVGVGACLRSAR